MDLKTWLDGERGRYTELARRLDVTVSRVSQMADDGVPPKFMLLVRDFSSGAVTLEEMVKARTPDAPRASAQPSRTGPRSPLSHPGQRSSDQHPKAA